ncbi:MAG: hypothetical protein AAB227_03350 [Pseudomonadota bacterium]
MRMISAILVLLALSACDRTRTADPSPPAAPAVEVREVAAADGYGQNGDDVNSVAFWSHPSVNFQSLLIAATGDGVKAFNIESGEEVASAPGPVTNLAVFYLGEGEIAQGYAIARAGDAYAVYAVANDAPALAPLIVTGAAPGADAFCISGGVLYEAGRDQLAAREIAVLTGGVVLSDARKVAAAPGVTSCHVDDRTGEVITIGKDGAIKRVDPSTGESFGLAFVDAATASALFLMTTPEPDNAAGGVIAVLTGASGVISLYDQTDGHALGAVRVKSTFDLDAVATAKTIAAGYGNYGGIYRDGALAVVTAGKGAPIRLVPWTGILDALKLTPGENVDPRTPQPVTETERVIDIEFAQP